MSKKNNEEKKLGIEVTHIDKKEEKDARITEAEFMEGVPGIEWDKEEEEPIKVTGSRLNGTIRVQQGEKFVVFKRKLSERKVIAYEKIGTESFALDKDLQPTTKEDLLELSGVKESQLEKSIYLQAALIKEWSKKEEITKEHIADDEELVEIREVAIKYMIKENKLGNFKPEEKSKS